MVYPECDLEFGYPELVGDICSYDKKYDDHFYRVKNDEYEAIWYDDGSIMIWHHVSKFLGEYDPTLFIDADGETEFATEWDENDPINPVYKNVFTHWPNVRSVFQDLSTAEKRKIQTNLQRLELLKNNANGSWGAETFTVVIAYNALFQKIPVETYTEARQLLTKIVRHETYNYNGVNLIFSTRKPKELSLEDIISQIGHRRWGPRA